MKWPWSRKPLPRARSEAELRAMAEEIAERFVALYDPAQPKADIPVMPIIEDISRREGLSLDELDRMVTHFSDVADEFAEAHLLAAVPAGRA